MPPAEGTNTDAAVTARRTPEGAARLPASVIATVISAVEAPLASTLTGFVATTAALLADSVMTPLAPRSATGEPAASTLATCTMAGAVAPLMRSGRFGDW